VFQTAGAPPRKGSSIFAVIGSMKNNSDALRKSVNAYKGSGGLITC
jgi:hypothetical protein